MKIPPQRIIVGASSRVDFDDILAPLVPQVIPRRLDRAVGRAERLHELHVQIRRQLEARRGINGDRLPELLLPRQQRGRLAGTVRGAGEQAERLTAGDRWFCLRFHFESREQVFDDQTLDIGQAEIAPGVTIGQAFVIEAQQMQERRM